MDIKSGTSDEAVARETGVFPPVGWLTNRQTAERLGVTLETLTTNWRWRDAVKVAGQTVRMPGGGRTRIYSVEAIERIVAEREQAARSGRPAICAIMRGVIHNRIKPDGWEYFVGMGKADETGTTRGTRKPVRGNLQNIWKCAVGSGN